MLSLIFFCNSSLSVAYAAASISIEVLFSLSSHLGHLTSVAHLERRTLLAFGSRAIFTMSFFISSSEILGSLFLPSSYKCSHIPVSILFTFSIPKPFNVSGVFLNVPAYPIIPITLSFSSSSAYIVRITSKLTNLSLAPSFVRGR